MLTIDGIPGPNPLIQAHEERGELLLPFALAFLVLLVLAVVAERRGATPVDGGTAVLTRTRLAGVAAVLAAVVGLVVTGLVVWIGHSGAAAVWGS